MSRSAADLPHFKRVLHVRPKMSCRARETVVQAPMPTLPIE
jgi:hypothetical protein